MNKNKLTLNKIYVMLKLVKIVRDLKLSKAKERRRFIE